MRLDQYLALIGDSKVEDWRLITRPTFRHHFHRGTDEKGEEVSVEVDEHRVAMSFSQNIRITLAYGLVSDSHYRIDPKHKFGLLNARSEFVDCFYDNILVHRETVVRVARQRCVLPEPADWTESPIRVPRRKARFARLIHVLAGPLTDFDEYFKEAGMVEVEAPWP
ncbi:MAG: hypothetical protein FJX54_05285 [Alphaproteobacteria bacterium]|nr:hypothetical protein [Alphaproteobacteria bacterium]